MNKLCKIFTTYVMLFIFLLSLVQVSTICSADGVLEAIFRSTPFGKFIWELRNRYNIAPIITPAPVVPVVTPSTGHKHKSHPYVRPVVPNKVPSAPALTAANEVDAYAYLEVTAVSTDANNNKISYRFEWTASKNGDTHIKESDFITSGVSYTDRFKYSAKDIGYRYTVEVIATDGYDDSYSSWLSFLVMPRLEDFLAMTGGTHTPAPDPPTPNPISKLPGTVEFEENPQGSPFELYGAVGDNYIYVWVGLAALFVGLGIYAYYTYTGRSVISSGMKRSLYRTLSRSGIRGTERDYDYQLTYSMSEPKRVASYRRSPVQRRRVKW